MLILIADDVVLEAVPKEECRGCYFWEKVGGCNSPIDSCYLYTRPIIWKPITDKTKKLLKKEL